MKKLMLMMLMIWWTITGMAQQSVSLAQTSDQSRRYDVFFLDAVCQLEKGNYDSAFDLLKYCVDIDSTRSETYYYLARCYQALKDKDAHFRCIRKANELEPDNATYLEKLAESYIAMRNYTDAAKVTEKLYALNHDRTELLGMLAQIYEETEDYDNAIHSLSRLEVAEGKTERLSFAKSQLYTRKGNHKAAINEMRQLADQYPNDLNYLCLYAATLYQNGQQKKAVDIYHDILRQEPDNSSAQLALLSYYNDVKDSAQVESYTERILVNKNTNQQDRVSLLRQTIARSEQAGGDSTRVLQLFHRILQQPQTDADMALLCATYMSLKKMPQDSIRPMLEKALEISPDNAGARLQLVSYAWHDEDRERVIALCNDARQYNPDEMAFYYYQGIAYYQTEKLDEALNAFQNGISVINEQSDPAIVSDFYAVMGDILHQKGKDREAFAAYDSCLAWKDDNIGCLNNYAYYLSVLGRDLDKAEQMSYRTIKAEPKNATYLDTYAWILFRQRRYTEAKIYIDQTLQCDSDSSAVLLEHAGDIYYHAGDKSQAMVLWQKALEEAIAHPDPQEDRKAILNRKIKLKKYIEQ